MLVYDITNRKTFENLTKWKQGFIDNAAPDEPKTFPFVVLGNKIDRESERKVDAREGKEWCDANHGIPFYVAAPISTLDLSMSSGALIPIEERSAKEVTEVRGVAVAPPGISVRHPAFDVTPGELITGIITEQGVATAPYEVSLPAMKARA